MSWGGTVLSGLGPPTSIINQENAHTALPRGQPNRDVFSIESLFSDDSNLYQVEKKSNQHKKQMRWCM